VIEDWAKRGLLLPQERWSLLIREYLCVSGRVRNCRPWWYDLIATDAIKVSAVKARSTRNRALSVAKSGCLQCPIGRTA
jgi:hypothetical protein